MQPFSRKLALGAIAAAALVVTGTAQADTGKLSLTGGITSIDGAAGGGITPWATIGTMGNELGVSAAMSTLRTNDYDLRATGIAIAYQDRFEFSIGKQEFGFERDHAVAGQRLNMDIVGVKVRVAGEAVLDSDNLMPQISVGLLHKKMTNTDGLTPTLTGLGVKPEGNELYVSATKLLLNKGLLLNGTLRYTNANQNGLLGFGSTAATGNDQARFYPEFSAAYLLRSNIAIGAEYRIKPNNLGGIGAGLAEDEWKDVFVAYSPIKNLTLTLAYVDLGRVAGAFNDNRKQAGTFLSAQVAF